MVCRELANAYEAQLGLDPFRKFLRSAGQPDLDDQQSQYYLGLFRYIVGKPGDKEAALEMATRAIDRVVLKIFQEKLPEDLLHSVLNVCSMRLAIACVTWLAGVMQECQWAQSRAMKDSCCDHTMLLGPKHRIFEGTLLAAHCATG